MLSEDSLRARLSIQRMLAVSVILTLVIAGLAQVGFSQTGTNPLFLFKNYFVTGDYVVAGWVEGPPDSSGYAPGTISVPDTLQAPYLAPGVRTTVPVGADIVAAYLYWATVEGNQSAFAGQHAFFNGYAITGEIMGNPNAPTSWSSGGCSGSSNGSKTMRTYRADVHPYLPVDTNPASPTFGALVAAGSIPVRLADSGSNGNTQPSALGASLVIIYRQLNPPVPLNAIVLYDGAYAPSNAGLTISQNLTGFYQPATNPVAKLTHIVANGQSNKGESVHFGNTALPSLYTTTFGSNSPAFPGLYGTWDNPTWVVSNMVNGSVPGFDTSETTTVIPTSTNSGCVSWGAIVMSTTVEDTDGDGLLDAWENNQGYNDVVRENDPPNGQNDPTSGQWVALPGANPNVKDLFVEVDYMTNLGAGAVPGTLPHSHLPQEATLDAVGATFANQHINLHFDLGAGIYPGDPFVIPYPLAGSPQAGTGGKAIPESLLFCTDGAVLCPYPNQPAVAWKGGLEFVQNFNNNPILGNFQPGRVHSYHYAFFGHSLGQPESFWGSVSTPINTGFGSIQLPQLTSITVTSATNNNTTITLQAPTGLLVTPGDCSLQNPPSVCHDANNARVTIAGALGQTALNGTYTFANVNSGTANGVTTTTFTVTTSGVVAGTYTYTNEPQFGVAYLGPSSTSGHSDIGGGDSIVTLGLWGADDPAGCQPDPTQPPSSGQVYCNNQVGTLGVQTGTLLHELGHSMTLTHSGTYYNDPNNPSLPSYELNCKPNYVSAMNYLFQVRGFVDGGFDYSDQTLAPLNETTSPVNGIPGLSEFLGVGTDIFTGLPAQHLTRWYSTPNALDQQLQATTGNRYPTVHCDGTPLLPNEPPAVRVDGAFTSGGSFSAPLDWNNDLITPDAVAAPGEDLNHNGILGDPPFSGFSDWAVLNGANSLALQQMSGRVNAFGLSSSSGLKPTAGGLKPTAGGIDDDGGGLKPTAGGLKPTAGGLKPTAGGVEIDEDTATSTADPPTGLACSDCVSSVENNPGVSLTWTAPNFGQVRIYAIWRAVGAFTTPAAILANRNLFIQVGTLSGTPPSTTFTDTSTTYQTYTYFVTETNAQGIQSAPSLPLVVTVAGGSTGTVVNLSPASAVFGQLVTLTATVTGTSGTPTGTVTFSVDGNPFGSSALSSTGTAEVQTSSLSVGSHSITASYAGNGDFSASTSSVLVLDVSQASTTTTLSNLPATVIFGQPATLTATVAPVAPGAGTPTGSVTFLDGANALGTVALSGGAASYSLSSVGAGNHSFNASYSGDSNFAGSSAPTYPLTIGKAAATVTLGNLSATFDGTPKSITATTNPAGLTVNITYNGSPTPPTNAGSYAVVATINSSNYQGSANGTLTIAKGGSVTTIVSDTPNPSVTGQVVTVSFKVAAGIGSSVPTGSVTVSASTGEACGPVILASGAGSCSITFATPGSRTLAATYSGDNNFTGSASAGVNQPVGDFSITATPAAQTISSGHQAFYTISVAPIDGLTGAVALSCTGAPPNSTCSVSPSTASLLGAPIQSTVTLSANKNVNHGTFTLTISGTLVGEGLTRSKTVQLTVK